MGTDIHGFVEIKKDGVWTAFNEEVFLGKFSGRNKNIPFAERDYVVFAMLAGVNNRLGSITPIDHPRGVPKPGDTSMVAMYKRIEINAEHAYHSKSYLSAKEIDDYVKRPDYYRSWHSREDFESDLEVLLTLGNPEDVRFVFWFDN